MSRNCDLFRAGKFLHDSVDDARVHRLNVGGKHRRDMAVAADQVFVEIPAWRLEWALACIPLVERMGALSFHLHLCSEGKAGAIFAVRGPGDLLDATGLLA